jgi:hypothetical protein
LVDWVQDAAKEQIRRKVRRKETAGFFERGGTVGWRYKAGELYEAGQGWIVVTLIGRCLFNYHFQRYKERKNETRCGKEIEEWRESSAN